MGVRWYTDNDYIIRLTLFFSLVRCYWNAKRNTDQILINFSLVEVILDEQLVYLIFEFLSMDLKKCIDKIPYGELMKRSEVDALIFTLLLP